MAFTFKPAPPRDALKFWQDKVPMSKKTFNALSEDDRVKAFIVGGMAKGDMLQAMHDSIGNALETGQSMQAWKKDVRTLFKDKGWDQLAGFRLDNIFRTNIQTAYSVGRYRQMMEVKDSRPYWRYSAINDARTRPTHSALHGRVVKADDDFWDLFFPPNGYRCRCTVTSLGERDMKRKGYKAETIRPGQPLEIPDGPQTGRAVPVMPDNNFRENPGKTYWKADTTRYRADVKQAVLKDIHKSVPDDLPRLKRHLTQGDLEDMQTLAWADGKQAEKGFADWAADVVENRVEKGELYPVGNLPGKVLRHLEKEDITPRLALVTVDDERIKHLSRAEKTARGQALTLEEIAGIPARFAGGQWYQDTEKPALLMTWIRTGGKWVKIVIELDYRVGKKKGIVANAIRTTGVVEEHNITKNPRYRKID